MEGADRLLEFSILALEVLLFLFGSHAFDDAVPACDDAALLLYCFFQACDKLNHFSQPGSPVYLFGRDGFPRGGDGSSCCRACGAVDGSFCVGCAVAVRVPSDCDCSQRVRTFFISSLFSHLTRSFECRSLAALANHKLAALETKRNVATVITRTRAAITDTPYIVLNRNVK